MLLPTLATAIGLLAADDPGPPRPRASAGPILARYEVDLVGLSRAVFALPDGPRTIRSLRWIPAPGSTDSWRSARLRLIWDGDDLDSPGVDLPLGLLLSPEPGAAGGGSLLVNRRPMPYLRSGRLVIDAEGPVRGSFRLDTRPGAEVLRTRGYLRAEVVPGPSPTDSPGDSPRNPEHDGAPAVRYWYDRRPGPGPTADGR
ncbi:hypothetical protein [Tautonia sociabilis]|uniref:DUF2961 domain-containing protein n=1 Tax=Tautonia sociabilis TaxID=2080755 RepID=A0A432MDW3_9BACT|nr:hypothetical protein [Tautonia sociabilis]RUL83192.1 hypothetical protein TsocGM_22620 [Tautonia sociabilis]